MDRPRRGNVLLAARLKDKLRPVEPNDWADVCRRIKEGTVIPILSNSVRNERIFEIDYGGALDTVSGQKTEKQANQESNDSTHTLDEQLAELWADVIGYPLADRYELARVAQFNRVRSDDAEQAKTKYLDFIKNALLASAESDGRVADIVDELRSQLSELSFSDIAKELDYPHFQNEEEDPLRIIARLPLPIYVTTSYYDFLERALQAEGRQPRTQICFWSGEIANVASEHATDPDFEPTPQNPLVYHLHGLEKYPSTMVLSEDDYLDFLVRVSQPPDPNKPLIPLYLKEALAVSSLALLGYRLQAWDFRVLFRGIIKQSILRQYSLVIQLSPEEQTGILNSEEARKYLQEYFEPSMFKVEWGDTDRFINKVWSEWNKWRRGQQ